MVSHISRDRGHDSGWSRSFCVAHKRTEKPAKGEKNRESWVGRGGFLGFFRAPGSREKVLWFFFFSPPPAKGGGGGIRVRKQGEGGGGPAFNLDSMLPKS